MKKTFIITVLVLTAIITIVVAVNETQTLAYAFSRRFSSTVYIVPAVGFMFAILLACLPDNNNNNNNNE